MSEPNPSTTKKQSGGKKYVNKSTKQPRNINTKKTQNTQKTSRIIQPGGRAHSNRWSGGTRIPNGKYNSADSVVYTTNLCETVAQQRMPSENIWQTKLHTITRDKTEQVW